MASPFSVFRKNQKVAMAILCLLAILAFTILPNLDDYMGTGGTKETLVATTSEFGNLSELDVQNLRARHERVLAILTNIMEMAGAYPAMAHYQLERMFGPATEESVINAWLLANHARQMGMVVSNDSILAFLKNLTQRSVNVSDFPKAFQRSGLTELQFLDIMRDELAALQLNSLFRISLMGTTPAERWEYFTRVNRMATIEAVPVAVANYIDRVKEEPTEEELKTFFEQNKGEYPQPNLPDPGFREPKKIALEYFKARIEDFTTLDKVTDEEIEERYQKNRERYDQPEDKPADEAGELESTTEPEEAKTPDATEPTELKETETPDAEDIEAPSESSAPEKSEDSPAVERASPFVLTSLLQDDKPAEEAATVETEEELSADKPATTGDSTVPAEGEPAVDDRPADAAPESQEQPAEPAPGLSEATKDRIRREIAYEKLQKVFQGLQKRMDEYRQQRDQYDVAKIKEDNREKNEQGKVKLPPIPKRPDFEKLAKENGLSVGRTGLISQWEARSSEIGESLVDAQAPVWNYAFEGLAEFSPRTSIGLQGDLYLFWKTSEEEERVPKFDDKGVRQRVLRAWKMIRARRFAMEEAESLAAKARKANTSLKVTFADRPDLRVILPTRFSWITFGNVPPGSAPQAARMSNVAGVEFAGQEFMDAVFQLKPDETGAALNAPQTVAYVIRVTEFYPTHTVLWKLFEVDDYSKYAPAGQADNWQIQQAWLDEIKRSAGFKLTPGRKLDQLPDRLAREED